MYKKLVAFLIKFRVAGLIVMAGITIFFITQLTGMEMYTQFLDLFPYNHRYVQVHLRYQKYFGSAYQATLVLEVKDKDKDVYNMETLKKIFDIHYDVDLIDGVDHFGIFDLASPRVGVVKETAVGISARPLMKVLPKNNEEINELRKKILVSPHYGNLVSLDEKALRLNANFFPGRIWMNLNFYFHLSSGFL